LGINTEEGGGRDQGKVRHLNKKQENNMAGKEVVTREIGRLEIKGLSHEIDPGMCTN